MKMKRRTERISNTRRARPPFAPVIILWGVGLLLSCGGAAQDIPALSGNGTLSWTNGLQAW
jgi:hypothetical protein